MFEERIEYAKRIMDIGRLNPYRSVSEGAYVIRYLRYLGKDEYEVRNTVEKMFYDLYGVPSRPDMSLYYKKSVAMLSRMPPLNTGSIYISKAQLDFIHEINDKDFETFVFAALCIYKYKTIISDKKIYYVLWKDVFKVANIKNSLKKIYGFLRSNEYISEDIRRGLNAIFISEKLLSLEDKDSDGLTIDNFINVVYYYLEWAGYGRFFRCRNCGCIEKSLGHGMRYCKPCARRVHINNTIRQQQERSLQSEK